jgi:hypothetical protein
MSDAQDGGERAARPAGETQDDGLEDAMNVDDPAGVSAHSSADVSGSGAKKADNSWKELTALTRKEMINEREQ